MAAPSRPILLRIGLLSLVLGGLALAFAAWGLATLATPGEELPSDADRATAEEALERFRLRLDLNARLQGSGLGLLAAGGVLVAAAPGSLRVPRVAATAGVGLAAALVVVVARWRSVGLDQFGTRWDHWVIAEAVGWALWAVALGVLLVLPMGQDRTDGDRP